MSGAVSANDEQPDALAVVPRWEWRTFAERIDLPQVAAELLSPGEVQESDERYLLSRRSDASVKVRDGLLDVKLLDRVSASGLEQWQPVLKAGFPVAVDDVGAVLAALGFPEPPRGRHAYELVELLAELVQPDDVARAVGVHKTRRRFTGGGCLAELTTIRVGDDVVQSVAVESEDQAAVEALLARLGFAPRPNTCVARGLKELVGLLSRRVAVIDVGTNSVKFHVAKRTKGAAWRTVIDRSEITRLGEGLHKHARLGEEPVARTLEAIVEMVDEARRENVDVIAAVGTAGMRMAANSATLIAAVEERTGVHVDVISGEEESRIAYLAVQSGVGLGDGSLVVFDTGGGSSQFTFGRGELVVERFSVDVGAVRFTERFGLDGPVSESVLAAAREAIGADLSRLDGRAAPDALVALGGVVTNMAAVKHGLVSYDPNVVQGSMLDVSEVERQIQLYRSRTADERREIVGLQPKRAEVVLAGACIVRVVMAKLDQETLVVSDRGLRHGLVADRFGPRLGRY